MKSNFITFSLIFLSISFITIGYASLTSQLLISGEIVVSSSKEVKITNVEISSQMGDGVEIFLPTYLKNETSMFVNLPNQDSSIIYNIEITNDTYNYYRLEDVIELSNSNSAIEYEFVDEMILFFEPNSINTIQIRFYYDSSISSNTELALNLKYNFLSVSYQRLDYLISTGTQYIDSGVISTGDYSFETDFYINNFTLDNGVWIFSGRKETAYTLGVFIEKNVFINSYGGSTNAYRPSLYLKNWYSLYFSRTESFVNGVSYPVSTQLLIPEDKATNILIGANIVNWDGSVDLRYFNGYMKDFIITDVVTGNIIRYFIPVRILDSGEYGYWDLIDNVFYPNIGLGNFSGS